MLEISQLNLDVLIIQQTYYYKILSMANLLIRNGFKVIAIEHGVSFYRYYSDYYKATHGDALGVTKHGMYSKADAHICLSQFDQYLWKLQGVKSYFIPNPA